jgi:DNA-binding SARP family transcriptional activator
MTEKMAGGREAMTENYGGGVLSVRMFGGFALDWNGKAVTGNTKSGESQFAYLLQLVLHFREKGVSRDLLEQVLFGERDIDDIHHATRSVVYNANRKLRAMGLPDVRCIQQKKGVCYWTDAVPVSEDAAEFERLVGQAGEEKDSDRQLELYLEACHCYKGEFLPAQTGVLWVAREARRYREMFCACVEATAGLLKERLNFEALRELGIYAAVASPLSNWETVTMEALVALGRYGEARKLYDDTVDLYFREQGLRPSPRMMELFHRLGEQMEHQYAALEDIQEKLLEEKDAQTGGFLCSYPVFQGIYRMVGRLMERGGQSVYLMLCMVVDGKGNPLEEGAVLEELTGKLKTAVLQSVRRSDTVTRYGNGQYLVLLVNTTRESCDIIQRRISAHFFAGRHRMALRYYVNSVECFPGMEF